uniref:Uncharacterized protein n=1 Tax=Glossina palpalis gambiensis TaxID=67801 RepID=A0A1B0BV05_9MUSC
MENVARPLRTNTCGLTADQGKKTDDKEKCYHDKSDMFPPDIYILNFLMSTVFSMFLPALLLFLLRKYYRNSEADMSLRPRSLPICKDKTVTPTGQLNNLQIGQLGNESTATGRAIEKWAEFNREYQVEVEIFAILVWVCDCRLPL